MLMTIAASICLVGLVGEIPPAPPQDGTFLGLFDIRECSYTGGGYRDKIFGYRLFVPITGGKHEKRPLIVWLHGHGEGGNDNTAHLRWIDRLIMPAPWTRERFPFFVLAVQCIDGNRDWTTNDASQDNMVDVAAAILDRLLREFPIDRERVYLSGVSSGGTGCWELAVRHPKYFAAVVPFSSGGTSRPALEQLVGIPIWVFHSNEDTKPPVDVVQRTVTNLQAVGGTVELTQIPTGDHDCWTAAFARYDVLDWLLLQRRGRMSWWDSPSVFAQRVRFGRFIDDRKWWQIVLAIMIPLAFVLIASRATKWRRRTRMVSAVAKSRSR
jgi:predicted esterase